MHKRLRSAREPRKREKERKGGLLFEVCARKGDVLGGTRKASEEL